MPEDAKGSGSLALSARQIGSGKLEAVVSQHSKRLDHALCAVAPGLSRRLARRLIREGCVFLDGRRCRIESKAVAKGARIVLHGGATSQSKEQDGLRDSFPSDGFERIYVDDDVVVVNKAAGVQVNETESTVKRGLITRLGVKQAFLVHRLDKDTSGVMVFAQKRAVAAELAHGFRTRTVQKVYAAIVEGAPSDGWVEAPLGRDPARPRAQAVLPAGRPAKTRVRCLLSIRGLSLLEVRPVTGRTHQIRVHLSHQGAPILGDLLYGGVSAFRAGDEVVHAPRTLLHSSSLSFRLRGKRRVFVAPLPTDFLAFRSLGLAFSHFFT